MLEWKRVCGKFGEKGIIVDNFLDIYRIVYGDIFLDIKIFFYIGCILFVIFCEVECLFFGFCCIKSYMWNIMNEDRLLLLVFMYLYYVRIINVSEIC